MSLKKIYDSIDKAIIKKNSEFFLSKDIGTSAYILERICREAKSEAYFFGETINNLFYSNHKKDILYFLDKIKCPIKTKT